jgi:hypothetical protein
VELFFKGVGIAKRGDLVNIAPTQNAPQRRENQNIPSKQHVRPLSETVTKEVG